MRERRFECNKCGATTTKKGYEEGMPCWRLKECDGTLVDPYGDTVSCISTTTEQACDRIYGVLHDIDADPPDEILLGAAIALARYSESKKVQRSVFISMGRVSLSPKGGLMVNAEEWEKRGWRR